MKTLLLSLLICSALPVYSQISKNDSITFAELKSDLRLMDQPFQAPPMKSLNFEYKIHRKSGRIKQKVVSLVDGKLIAKYKYKYESEALSLKKVYAKNINGTKHISGKLYYTDSGSEVALAKYSILKTINPSKSRGVRKVKVLDNGNVVDETTQKYTLEASAPPSARTKPQNTNARNYTRLPVIAVGNRVNCANFDNWYAGNYSGFTQQINSKGQLTERFYEQNGRQVGWVSFDYVNDRISNAMLYHNGVLQEEVFISYDSDGNVTSFQVYN